MNRISLFWRKLRFFRKHLALATTGVLLFTASPTASAGIVVLGNLSRDYQLKPGQTHESVIELENRDSTTRKVRVYQSDYRYLANGETFFPPAGSSERSNAGWVTFSPQVLTIPPMHKAQIRYLLRAPREQSKKGTYWSMLMIQEIAATPAMARTNHRESMVLLPTAGSRYGVQLITQLENTGKVNLEFTSATVESRNTKRILSVAIENRGTRIAKPEVWLEVYAGNGQKAGRFVSEKGTILPGCSVRREIDISSLPRGTYNSLFIADCGHRDVYGLEIKLVLEREAEIRPNIRN